MSIEQFETEMARAGYNEQQIAEAKAKIYEWVQQFVEAIEEVVAKFREFMASVCKGMKEAWAELKAIIDETLNEYSPSTKYLERNKRLAYINVNKFTNQVVKKYCNRDIRSMNMNFTRCRQKR